MISNLDDDDLGFVTKTGDGDYTVRQIAVGTSNNLTVSNSDGGSANPTIDLANEISVSQITTNKILVPKSADLNCRVTTDAFLNDSYYSPGINQYYLALFAGPVIIDNIAVVANDLVLVKNQTNPIENGIYRVQSDGEGGVFLLRYDMGQYPNFPANFTIDITDGSSYKNTTWATQEQVVPGVDPINFISVSNSYLLNLPGSPPQDNQIMQSDANGNLSWTYGGFNEVIYTDNGTWTVPSGVTRATFTLLGGGGPGGDSAAGSPPGGGGGAGQYARFNLDLTNVTQVTVAVGEGGISGYCGGATSVQCDAQDLFWVGGGFLPFTPGNNMSPGGAGGNRWNVPDGSLTLYGAPGSNGYLIPNGSGFIYIAGVGASSFLTGGGCMYNNQVEGNGVGGIPNSGTGGGGAIALSTSTKTYTGGAGGSGIVIINY